MVTEFLSQNFGLSFWIGVIGNLVASAVLGVCAFLYGRAFEKRSEANHERRHQEQLSYLKKIHEKVK